jgi:hypothetical protein
MPDYVFADFTTAGGTVGTATVQPAPSVAPESPAARWAHSEGAQQYEGRWVLVSQSLDALDSDLSPTALKDRHPQLPSGSTIVFVPPTTIRLGA